MSYVVYVMNATDLSRVSFKRQLRATSSRHSVCCWTMKTSTLL